MDVEQLNTKKVVRRMGARRRAQGGALAPLSPGKVVQLFSALLMTVKRSVDELFMHYFQNIRRLLGSSESELHLWTPLGDGTPRPPNLRTSSKNSAGAHG